MKRYLTGDQRYWKTPSGNVCELRFECNELQQHISHDAEDYDVWHVGVRGVFDFVELTDFIASLSEQVLTKVDSSTSIFEPLTNDQMLVVAALLRNAAYEIEKGVSD